MTKFIARKEFDWDGKSYKAGDAIEIPESHPRLGAMVHSKFVMLEPPAAPVAEPKPGIVKSAKAEISGGKK